MLTQRVITGVKLNKKANILSFSTIATACAVLLVGCTGPSRNNANFRNRALTQTLNNPTATLNTFANGRHALVLLKSNGKSQNPFDYQSGGGGRLYGGSAGAGGTSTGNGGPLYGGSKGNQPSTAGSGNTNLPINNNASQLAGFNGQMIDGLYEIVLSNNSLGSVSSSLYQGRVVRSVAMQVEDDSHVAVTTDGSGFLVTLPGQRAVQVGMWGKNGGLIPIDLLPIRSGKPSKVTCQRTVLGELCAVLHQNLVEFIAVEVMDNGRLAFTIVRDSFQPAGPTSTLKDVAFSPGGSYIYFATAIGTNPNAPGLGGELVACDIATVMARAENPQNSIPRQGVYGVGCVVGDPSYGQYRNPGDYTSRVGTQSTPVVPDGLIVNWEMVGAWNSVRGAYILQPPDIGEHTGYMNLKLGIVGPTEVRQYVPYQLGNPGSQGVFGYNYKFAVASPNNNEIILFGNKTSQDKQSFVKVLSTENAYNMGNQLDDVSLGAGTITAIGPDIGDLHTNDYTPMLNGKFVLVGMDTGLILIMSYFQDFKGLTNNGTRYQIPVYGFNPVSIAVRTSTPFISPNIPIKDLVADAQDDKDQNPGS